MPRPRRARLAAAALALPLLLAACGSGEATRGGVEGAVRDKLREREAGRVVGEEADAIATCVANGLFDPDRFSADERNAVTSAPDGEDRDPGLRQRVVDLVAGCEQDPDRD